MKCENCKHWTKSWEDEEYCVGRCDILGYYVSDEQRYFLVDPVTHHDFGCVKFEDKMAGETEN